MTASPGLFRNHLQDNDLRWIGGGKDSRRVWVAFRIIGIILIGLSAPGAELARSGAGLVAAS